MDAGCQVTTTDHGRAWCLTHGTYVENARMAGEPDGPAWTVVDHVPPGPFPQIEALRLGPDDRLILRVHSHGWPVEVSHMDALSRALEDAGLAGRAVVIAAEPVDIEFVFVPIAEPDAEAYVPRRRLRACVENWPDCATGEYNPSCCRFPKSCSCTVYDDDRVTDADLEPA